MTEDTPAPDADAPLTPLVPDDPDAAALEAVAGDGDPGPLPDAPRGTSELARVYAALLARAGETMVEPRLDATRRACELLGDIHTAAPVITITGTNGKTSTARMVDALLTAHGLRVGRFTSPHLHRVTERISVDSAEVAEPVFVRIHDEIAPVLAVVDAELDAVGRARLTFFEALTVLAFAVFADAPVDVMVLEVGMGGEWDSTNVADAQVCGFSPVGFDHMAHLGPDLTAIATTKAGILDRTVDPSPAPDPVAVVAVQEPEAERALAAQIAARGVRAVWEDRDFAVVAREKAVDGQLLTARGAVGSYPDLFLPLHGAHQVHNAALALAICEQFLSDGEKPLDAETVAQGFSQVDSPGRAEILRSEPTILVDGAHNPAGARVLADTIAEAFDFREVVGVLAMFGDKDPHGVLEHVHRFADRVVVTEAVSPRAMPVDELAAAAAEWWDPDDVLRAEDLNAALMQAIDLALADGEPGIGIVVTGSLATVAEARTLLGRKDA
ncbi:bifunctional folylpolyglutamate synthase/dihydrofolate synthase [Brevibacterium ihuae]|uniref:bifunctional folylpolyglutamate synthase/dihydrofolate synthase n=1 Tax=Brevibacterium ihuae TaxID=1631743 RepID=UPI000C78738E|nr:folylpolyglutamate synthase/dihydrofolate synthase family protein [Brevibacterium ihuae]